MRHYHILISDMDKGAAAQRRKRKPLLLSRLRDLRKNAGMTQVALAESLGVPQSFVSKYESDEWKTVSSFSRDDLLRETHRRVVQVRRIMPRTGIARICSPNEKKSRRDTTPPALLVTSRVEPRWFVVRKNRPAVCAGPPVVYPAAMGILGRSRRGMRRAD